MATDLILAELGAEGSSQSLHLLTGITILAPDLKSLLLAMPRVIMDVLVAALHWQDLHYRAMHEEPASIVDYQQLLVDIKMYLMPN